ncbi:hypothetical protein Tco_0914406 [Tanacetum coccineum]
MQESFPLEVSVGDFVLLKVSLWKGVVRFGKKEKLAPRFVGPFEIIEKVGTVAYKLDLPEKLNGVRDTFHVSNLKKCLADPTLQVPLDEIRVDAELNFVEEPLDEILLRGVECEPSNTQAVQAVKVWKHLDFLCHNYVLNGLVDSLYNVYCKTTTAKELWESLERKYKTEDAGTKKFNINLVEYL